MGLRERNINRLVLGLQLALQATWANRGIASGLLPGVRHGGVEGYLQVKIYSKERVVALSNSWRTVLRLHCLAENFVCV